jgi:hypothetical protein
LRSINVCIWKLDKTLEEIIPLIREDYSKPILSLMNCSVPIEEKVLSCKWLANGEAEYIIHTSAINNTNIRYLRAIAQIETNSVPEGSMILPDGTPLPKDLRVNNNLSFVLFIEYMGSTYSIVCGQKGMEGKIRSNLMESRKKTQSRWGEIAVRDIPGYTFDKSFYYWLLTNKGQTLQLHESSILLEDVRGFRSDTDRRENSYSGEGSNIDNEIPLKSLVSMDETLVSLKINIRHNNRANYSFYLDYDGRLGVFRGACCEIATQNPQPMELEQIFINLYFIIIPFLLSKFNQANQSGWEAVEASFKKRLSIDIITELMGQNQVTLAELETALSNLDNNANETA